MEKDEESGRYVSCHHPFTSPKEEDLHMLDTEPHKCRANAYDLVLNGNEVAGGSIRIHDQALQARVFKAIGLTNEEANEKFGFLLEALKFGAPPHGGMAFGLDRLAMLITGAETIKDVIAFPKTNKAACLMTSSPNVVTAKELEDLHIQLADKKANKKMTQTDTSWLHYPMGPATRNYLDISEVDYQGENSPAPSESELTYFQESMINLASAKKPSDQTQFVDLVEEWMNMGLSKAAIIMYESYIEDFDADSDYRALQAAGNSYMMEADLEEALDKLINAHELEPKELSPLVNIAQIYYAQHNDEKAYEWAVAGLRLEPNYGRLWELIASVFMEQSKEGVSDKVKELSVELNSFAGLSLAAYLADEKDALLRAQYLEIAYDNGIRDEEFLVEYTAALGMSQQYEKIPTIIWNLETVEKKQVSWKLWSHVAQAQLAMEQFERAEEVIMKLESIKDTPANVIKDLKTIYDQEGPQPKQ